MLVTNTGTASPDLINWMIVQLLDDIGIPEDLLKRLGAGGTMQEAPPEQDAQEVAMLEEAGMSPLTATEISATVESGQADTI